MDTLTARERCKEMLANGLTPYRAKKVLQAEGFDDTIVTEAMSDFQQQFIAKKARIKFFWRVGGLATFVICGGLFAYLMFFASQSTAYIVYPLLAASLWGLLKAAVP